MGSSGHSGLQHSPFRKCCIPSAPYCVILIPMIHWSQKSPEYLKQTGTSTQNWRVSGQGNTQCDWARDLLQKTSSTEQRLKNRLHFWEGIEKLFTRNKHST